MPSPFRRALAKADVVLDKKLGDQVRIVPMRKGDFASTVDDTRPVIEAVALVGYVDPHAADIAQLDARVPYEETEIEIRRALLPDGWKIRKGDEVYLLDEPGQPRHKVGRVNLNDPERVVVTLSRITDPD